MDAGDLNPRVEALEQEVRDLRGRVSSSEQDAAAARILAGAADRDVSEIRDEIRGFRQATAASSNAMRQDFVGLRQDFVGLRIEMRSAFETTAAGQQQIVGLLNTIITDKG